MNIVKYTTIHKYAGPKIGSWRTSELIKKLPVSLTKNLTARQIAKVLIFAEQVRKDGK